MRKTSPAIFIALLAVLAFRPISPASAAGDFDLKQFGAVCDGSHDDTKAIQAWLNKLGPNVRLTARTGRLPFLRPASRAICAFLRHQRRRSLRNGVPICGRFDHFRLAHNQRHRTRRRDWSLHPRFPHHVRHQNDWRLCLSCAWAFRICRVECGGRWPGNRQRQLCVAAYWFDGAGGVDLQPECFLEAVLRRRRSSQLRFGRQRGA